ncbi:MAG: hypothetical protein AAFR61_00150 [Bacteroidota bacterium]
MTRLFPLLALWLPLFSFSQSPALTYTSPVEETHFQAALDGNLDAGFQVLLPQGNPSTTAAQAEQHLSEFYTFLDQLKPKFDKQKKVRKRLALLYEAIHAQYFTQYVENPVFSDIFTKGTYNCVTATLLYAMALERYEIPYTIRKTPTHVYALLYPDTEKILFESTSPASGYAYINPRRVEAYRKQLVANKLISEAESRAPEFLEKHILGDSALNFTELLGVQYANYGIRLGENAQYQAAFQSLEKAYKFYPDRYIQALLSHMMALYLAKEGDNISSQELCRIFGKLYSYHLDQDALVPHLKSLIKTKAGIISEKGNGDQKLNTFFDCLSEEFAKAPLEGRLDTLKHEYLSDYYLRTGKFTRSLSHLLKVFSDENEGHRQSARYNVSELIRVVWMTGSPGDTLAKYKAFFPFLMEEEQFQAIDITLELLAVGRLVDQGREAEADQAFWALLKKHEKKGGTLPEELVSSVAWGISNWHIREMRFEKAREVLKKGLEFDPNNRNLSNLLEQIAKY